MMFTPPSFSLNPAKGTFEVKLCSGDVRDGLIRQVGETRHHSKSAAEAVFLSVIYLTAIKLERSRPISCTCKLDVARGLSNERNDGNEAVPAGGC